MKIRNGFVSNSSSSSFIIGIGVLNDEKAAKKIINEDDWDTSVLIASVDSIRSGETEYPIEYDSRNDRAYVESFNYDMVSVNLTGLHGEDKIIGFNGTGTQEEQDFWDGDEYDYDIDLEFTDYQEALWDMMYDKECVKKGDVSTGAGRDG